MEIIPLVALLLGIAVGPLMWIVLESTFLVILVALLPLLLEIALLAALLGVALLPLLWIMTSGIVISALLAVLPDVFIGTATMILLLWVILVGASQIRRSLRWS
jgi:hypothetical protein